MKKVLVLTVTILAVLVICVVALAEVPDISGMTQDELLKLQAAVSEALTEKATYTLLPGIYDCEKDFVFRWYNCKVLPGDDGEVRKATISFHTYTPDRDPFLVYEISSDDDGIKISLLNPNSTSGLFMVIEGASLQAVPFIGM